MNIQRFNIRCYGLLIEERKILLSDEFIAGKPYTKFPGGGLEFGEGTLDCIKREFQEECFIDVHSITHFYTTDFFVASAFGPDQIISIYYLVKTDFLESIKTSKIKFDFDLEKDKNQSFRWELISTLNYEDLSFPIDKIILEKLKNMI